MFIKLLLMLLLLLWSCYYYYEFLNIFKAFSNSLRHYKKVSHLTYKTKKKFFQNAK